ncbi:MAG: glycosyltransferase family 4 protein [Patescibacteria group bacterium]|nr:glycosyltransferase family 4 protein [Patescibacteria group bacterium]
MIGQKGIPALYGGVERHVEELAVRLAKRGHKVAVYTRPNYTSSRKKNYRGVSLVSLPSLPTKHFDAISHTFFATVHAMFQDYDIIHYHSGGPSLLSILPRIFRPSVKVIGTFHSIERRHQKWGWFARLVLRLGEWACVTFPHQTIAISRPLQKYCFKTYGKKTIYIPNGISGEFTRSKKARVITKQFGLMTDQYILTVARLIPPKGIHYLIEAYRRLNTRKRLVIAGDSAHTDGYVKKLKELAAGDPRIVFTGFQSGKTLAELYSNAYLFVLPSEIEGLPLALLEAAGFGRCSLASNIPENLEVLRVNKEVIGYVFKNKNVKDLQIKLTELLKRPEEMKKIGKHARQVVLQHFNWHTIARQTEKLYSLL